MLKHMKWSKIELIDLFKAWLAISIAFAIVIRKGEGIISLEFINLIILSAITVGIGFLLHELAHKAVAQKYQLWAEFRASNSMLVIAILFSLLLHIVFAAPGAVIIRGGFINKRRMGIISIAGPLTNFTLAIIFLIVSIFTTEFIQLIAIYGASINAWLGLFNLIPFGPFDGRKIFIWDKKAYFLALTAGIILFILA